MGRQQTAPPPQLPRLPPALLTDLVDPVASHILGRAALTATAEIPARHQAPSARGSSGKHPPCTRRPPGLLTKTQHVAQLAQALLEAAVPCRSGRSPKVLAIEAGGSYQRSWSYAKQSGWSISTTITVSPRRAGWLVLRPQMRTVRSNPVFHVERYSWGKPGGGQVNTTSWRGRGYNQINSRGAYYDAKANVLNSSGKPAGVYVAYDRAVTSSDC
ncbi:hypothetical protein [Streptomyces caniscabiei]|uniref:hypothetical protein n=1 Tax=Streptomyces caniscabiei TaxID=2746961 RepID=UPI00117DD542|nr:hypothetical protein [Streptomyces caniscabiei]